MSKRFVNSIFFGPLCVVFLISLIWPLHAPAFAQARPPVDLSGKNVLILHSHEANAPIFLRTDSGISATLVAGGISSLNQHFVSLDLRRNPSPRYRKLMADQMRIRFGHVKTDAIITMYPEALDFILRDCQDIFPVEPIVALYMYRGLQLGTTGRRVIQHFPSLDVKGSLEIALQLVPGTKRVYVMGGAHEVDRWAEDQARRDFKKWEGRLEFFYLSHMTFEDMLATASHVPPGSIIFALTFTQDAAGKNQTVPQTLLPLSKVAAAPIFGIVESGLGYGIVGGNLVNFERIGSKAGELVLNFLRGTALPKDATESLDVPPVPMFDWLELKRWKLSEAALPKGSVVINRETTLWDFKYYIIGGIIFCLAETVLIIILIAQRRRRRSAEELLLRKTEELDQFFDVSQDFLCIANTDEHFLRLNPAWERTLGFSREELMAKRFLEFVHPDDLLRTQEAVSAQISRQKVINFENRYRCKDGTYRWLEWNSVPAGKLIYAAARDITERKRAEQGLEERLRFEELLSNISSRFANLLPDRVDQEIEESLKQVLDFFKVDRCALLQILADKTSWLITHVAAQESVPPVPQGTTLPVSMNPWAYDKLILKQEVLSVSRIDDLPAEANVDKQTWIEWGIRSNLNIPIILGGPVNHVFAINSVKSERVWPEELFPRFRLLGEIFVNALQRKQAEVEVNRARQQLLHVERSARLGELTASLAHELNQPLAAILSNAQAGLRFLQSDQVNLDEFREILNDIVHDDQRAGNVIRSLRSMMKREERERNPTILNDVLRDVTEIFRTESIFRNVHIETEFDESLPPILADKVQLQQVMLNLTVNAADAMSQSPPERRKIILRTQAKDNKIRVTIRDFGPGINKGDLERIFQPFFTTKGTGLGMGLAVSETIVEAHGGRIWAENSPDAGATFFIELPIISDQ